MLSSQLSPRAWLSNHWSWWSSTLGSIIFSDKKIVGWTVHSTARESSIFFWKRKWFHNLFVQWEDSVLCRFSVPHGRGEILHSHPSIGNWNRLYWEKSVFFFSFSEQSSVLVKTEASPVFCHTWTAAALGSSDCDSSVMNLQSHGPSGAHWVNGPCTTSDG